MMSGVNNMANNDNEKRFSGKFCDHLAFNVNVFGRVKDGGKINCLHCIQQFASHGSNSSLTYHFQHVAQLNSTFVARKQYSVTTFLAVLHALLQIPN